MPNHCCNRVIIEGDKDIIAKMAAKLVIEGDMPIFYLNAFLPIPEALEGTIGGSQKGIYVIKGTDTKVIEDGWSHFKDTDGNRYERTECEMRPWTAEESQALIVAYGADNWYDWRCTNWGTKWGFYNQSATEVTETSISFTADTAWSPADNALAKISEKYGVTITNHYCEQGGGYMGTTVYTNGEGEQTYEYSGSFYANVPDDPDEADKYWEDPDLVEEVREFTEKHGIGLGG